MASEITKKALGEAMKTLMASQTIQKVSVSDVCALCGINRKSFYYHFRDKYDLVNWIFYSEFIQGHMRKEPKEGWAFIHMICDYFYENRAFYLNAMEATGQNAFTDYLYESLRPYIFRFLRGRMQNPKDRDFAARFFTDAFRCSIMHWLRDNTERTPEEFMKVLQDVMTQTARLVAVPK